MYFGMIHPVTFMPIKGVLWYQGESNGNEGDSYLQKMQALINGWRLSWKNPELPFYYVQLANFTDPQNQNPMGGDGWGEASHGTTASPDHPAYRYGGYH